jgi:hypothetical protein
LSSTKGSFQIPEAAPFCLFTPNPERKNTMTTIQFSPEVIRQAFERFQATLSQDLKFQLNGRLERGERPDRGVACFDDLN